MNYMDINTEIEESDVVLLGIPYDGTTSYRPGARFAPNEIRSNALIGYETYSPIFDRDLLDIKLYDAGDLEVSYTAPEIVQRQIYNEVNKYLSLNKKVVSIGGEHSVTSAIIKAYKEKFGDVVVIQLDAHTDLREEYLGNKYSHACVMKRVGEIIGFENIYQFGIRSGLKEEFEFSKKNSNLFMNNLEKIKEIIPKLKDKQVYITIDLDVLDPAFMPGTGTPEPGGVSSKELFEAIKNFGSLNNIIGFDVVELAPRLDFTQISTAVAVKVLREMLLIL